MSENDKFDFTAPFFWPDDVESINECDHESEHNNEKLMREKEELEKENEKLRDEMKLQVGKLVQMKSKVDKLLVQPYFNNVFRKYESYNTRREMLQQTCKTRVAELKREFSTKIEEERRGLEENA